VTCEIYRGGFTLSLVDQQLSLASKSIVINNHSITIDISWLNATMPTSHISDDDASGSNASYHFIKYVTRSTMFIIFPLRDLINQPTVDTSHPKDDLAAL
jgi:hypothetical protein